MNVLRTWWHRLTDRPLWKLLCQTNCLVLELEHNTKLSITAFNIDEKQRIAMINAAYSYYEKTGQIIDEAYDILYPNPEAQDDTDD